MFPNAAKKPQPPRKSSPGGCTFMGLTKSYSGWISRSELITSPLGLPQPVTRS